MIELAPRRFIDLDHPELKLADLFWSKIFGLLPEVFRKAIDVVSVGIDRSNGHVAEQHIFSHSLGNWGETLVKRSHKTGFPKRSQRGERASEIARDLSMIAVTRSAIVIFTLIVNGPI